jgi:hypothetical protein
MGFFFSEKEQTSTVKHKRFRLDCVIPYSYLYHTGSISWIHLTVFFSFYLNIYFPNKLTFCLKVIFYFLLCCHNSVLFGSFISLCSSLIFRQTVISKLVAMNNIYRNLTLNCFCERVPFYTFLSNRRKLFMTFILLICHLLSSLDWLIVEGVLSRIKFQLINYMHN